MAVPYSGRDAVIVHVPQTYFGTSPALDAAGTIKGTTAIDIDPKPNVREAGIVTGQRWKIAADVRTDFTESMPTISESGTAFKANLAEYFYSVFQQVTEAAGTPYKKTFTFHDTQPDFASDAGHYETLIIDNPEASTDQLYRDCILSELTLSVEPGGELMFDANYVSRDASGSYASSYTGTVTRTATSPFTFSNIVRRTVNVNDAGASSFTPIGQISVVIGQEVLTHGVDGSGDGRFETFMMPYKYAKGSMVIAFDSVSRGLRTAMQEDYTVDFNLAWGGGTAGDTDGDLDFSGPTKITSWKQEPDEQYKVNVEFEFTADDAADEPLDVILADAVDKTW